MRRLPALLLVIGCSATVKGPLTDDFQTWLSSNGYANDNFVRKDYGTQGSYGGKSTSNPNSTQIPVIFCHGNSDTALHTDALSTGWDNSITYFEQNGYTTADLYATSWGDNNALLANTRTHSCKEVQRLRNFVISVLTYTGSPKVSIVGHSMGVTLMRKAVKGGKISANDGSCDLGNSLAGKVDVFVGLAGANYGLCACEGLEADFAATCNKKDGFWPGDSCGLNPGYACGEQKLAFPCNGNTYSNYLTDLNKDPSPEATYVFSAWSHDDDLIKNHDMVFGRPISLIPTSTGQKMYPSYTHMQTKEKTAADQYQMVHNHVVPS